MFDFIFDNIFILIPVAIFVGLRILEARRKQQEAANPPPPPVYEEEVEPPPSPVKKKKPKAAAPKAAIPDPAAFAAPIGLIPDSQRPRPYRPEFPEKPFPENLDYLPPLQRALALSEILGPPKGLQ